LISTGQEYAFAVGKRSLAQGAKYRGVNYKTTQGLLTKIPPEGVSSNSNHPRPIQRLEMLPGGNVGRPAARVGLRRGGAIDGCGELAGELQTLDSVHQTLIQGHRGVEKSATNSPRRLVWPGNERGARTVGRNKIGPAEIQTQENTEIRAQFLNLDAKREPRG